MDWWEHYGSKENKERRREELDMLMKTRELSYLHNKCHKCKIAKLAIKKVKQREFDERALVFCGVDKSRKVQEEGKLAAT